MAFFYFLRFSHPGSLCTGSAPASGLDDIFGRFASGGTGIRGGDDGPGRIDDMEDDGLGGGTGAAGKQYQGGAKGSSSWGSPWR